MRYNKRICNVCGCEEHKVVFRQQFAHVEGISFIDEYDVVVCEQCGFIFASNIPEQKEFDKYYVENSKYESVNEVVSDTSKERYDATIQFCEEVLKKDGKDFKECEIVDVGCSTGEFLRYLSKKDYQKLYAIDPSEFCINYLKQKNIIGYQKTISELDDSKTYDFVRLNAVLEHIEDLNSSIHQLRKIVKPNGFLYLSVPNVAGFDEIHNCPFQEFSVEHINYFSIISLENLMKKNGFKLLGYKINTNIQYSEIEAIFKPTTEACSIIRDDNSIISLEKYVADSAEIEKEIGERIEQLVKRSEPIIVWGMGTHTLRELVVGELGKCNIVMFVDSNVHYQDKEYNGIPICSPKAIDSDEIILVSSYFAQNAIINCARNELGLSNEMICLYDVL